MTFYSFEIYVSFSKSVQSFLIPLYGIIAWLLMTKPGYWIETNPFLQWEDKNIGTCLRSALIKGTGVNLNGIFFF